MHPTIEPTASPRYPGALFRSPRPRLSQPSRLSQVWQDTTSKGSAKTFYEWSRSILSPDLPAIKQHDGQVSGFFDQAFMVVAAVLLSTVAGGTFIAFRALRKP
jgi:hypothetical protein